MKFIKRNKGVLIFYLLIVVTTLVLVNNNKTDTLTKESGYDIVNGVEVVISD